MSEILFMGFKPGERSLDWEFIDPDTSFHYRANSRAELVKIILLYRANNRLEPIENLDAVLDNYLCYLPQNSGKCRPQVALRRGLAAYYKGAVLLLKSLWYKTTVSQEEADQRSSQCKDCKFNGFPDKTERFIKWSDSLAEATVGQKKSKYHKDLGNCSVCSCPLRCKVFYNGAVDLDPHEEEQMKSVDCWQLKLPRE